MYILYNLITYATGACLGSHSIGTAHSLKYQSSSTTPMHNTNPEGIETFRVLLYSAVRSSSSGRSLFRCWPSFVPLFGFCACYPCRSPCRRYCLLSVSSGRSTVPARRVGIVFVPVSALRSLCHPCPGSPAVFLVSCPTTDNVRFLYATTVRQKAGRARGLQRSCGRSAVGCRHLLRSCSHALPTLRKRYANALPVCGLHTLRWSAVSGIARAKATATGNATGKGKGKPSVPRRPGAIHIRCSAQKIRIRHKKSILGNEKSEIGNEKTYWEIKKPPPRLTDRRTSREKPPYISLGNQKSARPCGPFGPQNATCTHLCFQAFRCNTEK